MIKLVIGLLSFLIGLAVGNLGVIKTLEWIVVILGSASLIFIASFLTLIGFTIIVTELQKNSKRKRK